MPVLGTWRRAAAASKRERDRTRSRGFRPPVLLPAFRPDLHEPHAGVQILPASSSLFNVVVIDERHRVRRNASVAAVRAQARGGCRRSTSFAVCFLSHAREQAAA